MSCPVKSLKAERIIVLGGTKAVSDGAAKALAAKTSTGKMVRLGGADRYETSRLIYGYLTDEAGVAPKRVLLASGAGFADAWRRNR